MSDSGRGTLNVPDDTFRLKSTPGCTPASSVINPAGPVMNIPESVPMLRQQFTAALLPSDATGTVPAVSANRLSDCLASKRTSGSMGRSGMGSKRWDAMIPVYPMHF